MTYSYYTNIQDRREAIKEAVAVLLEHEPFQDTKGESQFLSVCADENLDELVDASFEACSTIPLFDWFIDNASSVFFIDAATAFQKSLNEKIIKHFGSLEAYTAFLIKISPNDERIEKLLAEKYDYYSLSAFNEKIDTLEFHDVVELFLKCKNKEVIAEYRDGIEDYIKQAVVNGDEETIKTLLSLKVYKYFEEQELCTYNWVKNSLDGEDKVAEIASKHLFSVIRYKEDLKWLKEEAAAEVPQAQYLMALLYLPNGLDIVNENKSLAVRYLQAAKEGGCALADAELQKLGPDAATAFEDENALLTKANKGNKGAMFELGNLYAFEGNDAEAKKWWNKASRKGHTGAKKSKKKGRLKKRPISCCAAFLIAIVIIIITLIVIGFTWGKDALVNTIFGIITVLGCIYLILIKTNKL